MVVFILFLIQMDGLSVLEQSGTLSPVAVANAVAKNVHKTAPPIADTIEQGISHGVAAALGTSVVKKEKEPPSWP